MGALLPDGGERVALRRRRSPASSTWPGRRCRWRWPPPLLGLAVRYLRRTRPDVRPWRIPPDAPAAHLPRRPGAAAGALHPRPGAGPGGPPGDRAARSCSPPAPRPASSAGCATTRRSAGCASPPRHSEGAATTPVDVVPGRWRIEGTLGPDRSVALDGDRRDAQRWAPCRAAHLAFELNPLLEIAEARAGEGGLTLSRSWDRLAVELAPPIPPGGRREIRFRLAGAPADADDRSADLRVPQLPQALRHPPAPPVRPRASGPLEQLSGAGDLAAPDPARAPPTSRPSPATSPGSWTRSSRWSEESYTPQADVTLALAGPPGLLLADACGGIAALGAPGGRLPAPARGSRRAGRPLPHPARPAQRHDGRRLPGPRQARRAAPGVPRTAARAARGGLARAGRPAADGGARMVRRPGLRSRPDRRRLESTRWRGDDEAPFRVLGNLVLLSEGDLIQNGRS